MKALISCVTTAALAVSFAAAFAADSSSTGDAVNGKRLFMTVGCYECHGTTGAGGGFAGPRLAPIPLPFVGVKAKLRTASGRMPVYAEAVLKDSQIADIYAYLQSIPNGKSAHDIELLRR
jgi:mono/diheme cytochrome c family protein